MKGKKACPLAARIKKLMQADDDVGKIAQATPVMLARAMELFLERLCEKTSAIAQARQAKTISASHLKQCVADEETLDFLREVVAAAPDLPAEDAVPAKPRRKRAAASDVDGDGEPGSAKKPRARSRKTPQVTSGDDMGADAMDVDDAGPGPSDASQSGLVGAVKKAADAVKKPRAPRRKKEAAAGDEDEADTDPEADGEGAVPAAKPARRARATKTAALSVIQTATEGNEDDGGNDGDGNGGSDSDGGGSAHQRGRRRASGARHMQGLLAPNIPPVQQEPCAAVKSEADGPSLPRPRTGKGSRGGGRAGKAVLPVVGTAADTAVDTLTSVDVKVEAGEPTVMPQGAGTGLAVAPDVPQGAGVGMAGPAMDAMSTIEQQCMELATAAAAAITAAATEAAAEAVTALAAGVSTLPVVAAPASPPVHKAPATAASTSASLGSSSQAAGGAASNAGMSVAVQAPAAARLVKKETKGVPAAAPPSASSSTSSLRSALPFSMRRPMIKKSTTPAHAEPPFHAPSRPVVGNGACQEVVPDGSSTQAPGGPAAVPSLVSAHAPDPTQAVAPPAIPSNALGHLSASSASAPPQPAPAGSTQPCAPSAPALPVLPPTAHLAHLAATSAQDYDDDYDNL